MALTANCKKMVFTGVLNTGWSLVRGLGSEPERAIAYHMRVPVLALASETATVELSSAQRTSHHTPPQTRFATTMAGSSDDPGSVPMMAVPQPMMTAQVTENQEHAQDHDRSDDRTRGYFAPDFRSLRPAERSHPSP